MSQITKTCKLCGATFQGINRKVFCSETCSLAYHADKISYRIRERDEFRCAYCGKSSIEDGISLVVDHIVPWANGGEDEADNLITACQNCNSSKSKRELSPDVISRLIAEVKRRNATCGINDHASFKFPGHADSYPESQQSIDGFMYGPFSGCQAPIIYNGIEVGYCIHHACWYQNFIDDRPAGGARFPGAALKAFGKIYLERK